MKKLLFVFLCSFGMLAQAQTSDPFYIKQAINNSVNFTKNVWNSEPMVVGRNFTSTTSDFVGYISVIIAWTQLLSPEQPTKKFENFLVFNGLALALFMGASAIKTKTLK